MSYPGTMTQDPAQLDTIAAFLRDESTLSLATVSAQGDPCIAPLFYIVDDRLNLYWLSSSNSLHGRNLAVHLKASAAVYRQTEDWKEICGVQMRGRVHTVTAARERNELVKAYCQRFGLGRVLGLAIRRSTLYAFHPEWFRYIDNSKHFGYNFEITR